jgi:hypothetical protein
MMPSETSYMPSFEKMGMMYGENNGTCLHQEFHYKLITTRFVRTKCLLLIWWLLT